MAFILMIVDFARVHAVRATMPQVLSEHYLWQVWLKISITTAETGCLKNRPSVEMNQRAAIERVLNTAQALPANTLVSYNQDAPVFFINGTAEVPAVEFKVKADNPELRAYLERADDTDVQWSSGFNDLSSLAEPLPLFLIENPIEICARSIVKSFVAPALLGSSELTSYNVYECTTGFREHRFAATMPQRFDCNGRVLGPGKLPILPYVPANPDNPELTGEDCDRCRNGTIPHPVNENELLCCRENEVASPEGICTCPVSAVREECLSNGVPFNESTCSCGNCTGATILGDDGTCQCPATAVEANCTGPGETFVNDGQTCSCFACTGLKTFDEDSLECICDLEVATQAGCVQNGFFVNSALCECSPCPPERRQGSVCECPRDMCDSEDNSVYENSAAEGCRCRPCPEGTVALNGRCRCPEQGQACGEIAGGVVTTSREACVCTCPNGESVIEHNGREYCGPSACVSNPAYAISVKTAAQ